MGAGVQSSVKISASISTGRKFRAGFSPLIIKFIILLCGCLGSAFTFLTCIEVKVGFFLTASAVFIACGYFSFIFSFKGKYFYAASGISAAVLTASVFAARNYICAGFAHTANAFMAKIRLEYRDKPFIYITEPEAADIHIRAFICFAAVLMCFLAAHSAMRANSASGVCIATCTPVFSVLMFGLEPNNAAFFSVIVCWAAMFALESNAAENISDERCKKYSAYCGLYTAVISALCIAAVLFSSRLLGYERPERLNEIYDGVVEYIHGGGVKQTIDEIVTKAIKSSITTGAINHGKLGEFDEISFDGRTVLEVSMPKSNETVYLRGFTGSVYTGRSWEQLPASKLRELESITDSFYVDGLSPLLMDGYNLKYTRAEMPQYSFAVKNLEANSNYLYMPYNLVPESVSRYGTKDGSSFTGSSPSYIGQFYDPRGYYGYQNLFRKKWSVPTALSEDETVYRQFVYENYLDIPDSFSPEKIFDESYYRYISAEEEVTGKSTLVEMTVFSRKLYFIKKWLRDNCEYSLSAGKLPAGEDFVNHFLENRTGSCSHFASAAVIMCRYAGIPARYAEGYVIKPADFPSDTAEGASALVEVTDARGHAWAEIYLDGFGWYPVEFTSGYGNVRTAIPTETAVTETEAETEISEEFSESAEASATGTAETSPVPAETASAVTAAAGETNAPAAAPPTAASASETEPALTGEETPSQRELSVGFGIFGIKGSRKVDIWYDLTAPFIAAIIIIAVPAVFVLRRNMILAKRRRTAQRSESEGVLDDYRRFAGLMKLMKMPEQEGLSYSEYIQLLSERSEILRDGTAELAINSALKASFGGGSVTRGEAREMRLAVNSLAKLCFASASRTDKFRLKYIYCII